jgi:hypothetical protein
MAQRPQMEEVLWHAAGLGADERTEYSLDTNRGAGLRDCTLRHA